MQNNVLPLSNINRPQVLSSLSNGFQYNSSAINKNISQLHPQNIQPDRFSETTTEQPRKNTGKEKFIKYAKKYALPAIALLGAIGIGAFFILHGKNKTKKPVSAPNTGKFAPKTTPVKNTADKEQRITKPPKPNKETEIWVENSSKKCVYTSDMEEYISNDVQYKASSDNPKTELYHWFKKLKKR